VEKGFILGFGLLSRTTSEFAALARATACPRATNATRAQPLRHRGRCGNPVTCARGPAAMSHLR